MTKFEDQLYDDLMREHGPALASIRVPEASRRHVAPRRVLVAVGAGGVAVAATVGVLASGSGTGGGSPAYALTANPNGTIDLAVYQASGIAQANKKLRQLGDDDVVVVPVRPGCPGINSLRPPAVPPKGRISVQGSESADGSITVNAGGVPRGDILVVAVETFRHGKDRASTGASRLTSPPAPSCVSPLPRPPAPGSSGHGAGTTSGSGGGPGLSESGNG
ncbi:MAG: hypothetical protein J2P25_06755 [Nocardiopsaceae bacterium]|nr:hypothetical protein [Nocardiopsaceae bacterium]